jgi:hypothetical protein
MERNKPQRVGNAIFDSRLGNINTCIGEPGIFELANIETVLINHRLEADLIIAVAALAEKEVESRN